MRRSIVFIVAIAMLHGVSLPAQSSASWLDRPLLPWNEVAAGLAAPERSEERPETLEARCGVTALAASGPAAMLRAAGWTPFLHLDQSIARGDVEVIGGMSGAGSNCAPTAFNLFVFVDGRFAGTLSPATMVPGRDGAAGAVRLTGADTLTAEFARFGPSDPECCPSSRVRVSYRIDKGGVRALIVPVDVRQLR